MIAYDIPLPYKDYTGYILHNGGINESSGVVKTENLGGLPRIYVTKDLGEFNNSFRLIDGSFVKRVVDYKVQADSKNYYYFNNSLEWVVYHTLNEESYYGNKFYPILGAVSCYDENDEEIHPTDIVFYPECIKDGIFEGAKVIIKWASNQSGKVCFNPGFSDDESQDQSRLILPVSRYNWTQASDKMVCTVGIDRERRPTSQNIIEPFMTVDAIDNGNIVEYKFVSHVPDSVTDNNLKPFYYGNIRIRADRRFFINLDKMLTNENNVNTDILNTIIVGSNTLSDIVNVNYIGLPAIIGRSPYIIKGGFFDIYDPFVYNNRRICLDLLSIPSTTSGYDNLESSKYVNGNEMGVFNAGYIYDEDAQYKHQMKYYTCGISPSHLFLEWILSDTSVYSITRKIERYEIMKPLIKAPGLDGYLKIVSKSKTHPLVAVDGGKFECEYVLEFPCCPGSAVIRSGDGENGMVNMFVGDEYRLGQIFYPQSIIKAGGFHQEPNERLSFDIDKSFTTTVLVENGFPSTTYRRTKGGVESEFGVITYPTNEIYRNVVPNRLDSLSDKYEIEVLKKVEVPATSGRPKVDMKLFVLYRNDKWRYDRDKLESVSGRENPSYIFEIDVETMLLDFSDKFKEYPTLPDVKRWFTAYCRGFAHIANESYAAKVPEPDSELVLEIWDIVTRNWRSITPSKNDDIVIEPDEEAGIEPPVYINEYRTFKFGGETVVSDSVKIKKYFDLKSVLAKYIEGNKIYFRARVCRSREFGIKKNTTDVDAFHNGDPWGSNPINPSAVNRDENISQFGLDYFRMETL